MTAKKNNKMRARETRKRKKDYVRELEEKVMSLTDENTKLKEQINKYKERETKANLDQDNATQLERVLEEDRKFVINWMNGAPWVHEDQNNDSETAENESVKELPVRCQLQSNSRIKFIDWMFDIILRNLVSEKYKFKLHNNEDVKRLNHDEIKRLGKLTKVCFWTLYIFLFPKYYHFEL